MLVNKIVGYLSRTTFRDLSGIYLRVVSLLYPII
jgi:hypothetical protein